jgi:flagellar basal body-associated protein FliL
MSVKDKMPGPVSSSKQRARQLKIIGVIILLLGIAGAGVVYWMGTRSPDLSDDLSMVGYNKPEERQMEILYGKQGELIEDWLNDLKQPGTQAIIIATASAIIAAGCFYFARLLDDEDKPADETR